jgi:hypothetical protein
VDAGGGMMPIYVLKLSVAGCVAFALFCFYAGGVTLYGFTQGQEVKERTAFVQAKAVVGASMSQCWTELDGFYVNGTKSSKPTVKDYLKCVEDKLKEARRYVAPDATKDENQ